MHEIWVSNTQNSLVTNRMIIMDLKFAYRKKIGGKQFTHARYSCAPSHALNRRTWVSLSHTRENIKSINEKISVNFVLRSMFIYYI